MFLGLKRNVMDNQALKKRNIMLKRILNQISKEEMHESLTKWKIQNETQKAIDSERLITKMNLLSTIEQKLKEKRLSATFNFWKSEQKLSQEKSRYLKRILSRLVKRSKSEQFSKLFRCYQIACQTELKEQVKQLEIENAESKQRELDLNDKEQESPIHVYNNQEQISLANVERDTNSATS